jgi:hypothetical protein
LLLLIPTDCAAFAAKVAKSTWSVVLIYTAYIKEPIIVEIMPLFLKLKTSLNFKNF